MTPCYIHSSLTFINVTLSGRDHFQLNCTQDWCTHCLNPDFLVFTNFTYHTVIDHHPVVFDSAYDLWQTRCAFTSDFSVFSLFSLASAAFIDVDLVDLRYKMKHLIEIRDYYSTTNRANLILLRTRIQRMDFVFVIIACDDFSQVYSEVFITECIVEDFNRDHSYQVYGSDSGFLSGKLNLNLHKTEFIDIVVQSRLGAYSPLIKAYTEHFSVADTVFTRCMGAVQLIIFSPMSSNFSNVTFQNHFSSSIVLSIYSTEASFVEIKSCQWINCLSYFLTFEAPVEIVTELLFRNNRLYGSRKESIIELFGETITISNCKFEGNGAFDSSFTDFWADYYISNGLLNSDPILFEERANFEVNSLCYESLLLRSSTKATLVDSSFSSTATPCENTLTFLGITDTLKLSNVRITSNSQYAVMVALGSGGQLYLQDAELGGAGTLLAVTADRTGLIQVSNVTFQDAKGLLVEDAPCFLSSVHAVFRECNWKRNVGIIAGGVAGQLTELELYNSTFSHNACFAGSGDLAISSDNSTILIANCTFTESQSSLGTGSIAIEGELQFAWVKNCTFQAVTSYAGAVLDLTLSSGTVHLDGLIFLHIASNSTSLLRIQSSAHTVISDLQVLHSTFYRGLVVHTSSSCVLTQRSRFLHNYGSLVTGCLYDHSSLYLRNSAAISLFLLTSLSTFTDSQFRENMLDKRSLIHVIAANVTLRGCYFTGNEGHKESGMLQWEQRARGDLVECRFESNGAFFLISALNTHLLVHSSTFLNTESLFQLNEAEVTLRNSSFITAYQAMITSLTSSKLTIEESFIGEIQGDAGCLLSGLNSSVLLLNSHMQAITCEQGLVMLSTSILEVKGCVFAEVSAQRGNMVSMKAGELRVKQVQVKGVKSVNAVFDAAQTAVSFQSFFVTDTPLLTLHVTEASVLLHSCHFASIYTSDIAAALHCEHCLSVEVRSSVFEDMTATSSIILASATEFKVLNSTFRALRAKGSGAVQVTATAVAISDSLFTNNTASRGGAIQISASSSTLVSSRFTHNTAQAGGAIFWMDSRPALINVFFNSNRAEYGSNEATYLTQLWADSSRLSQLTSGKPSTRPLLIFLQDALGQNITTDNDTYAWLTGKQLSGSLTTKSSGGVLTFDGFSLKGQPSTSLLVTVTTDNLSLPLDFTLLPCDLGDILVDLVCTPCQQETYALSLSATECSFCPTHAECPGGSRLYPQAGYWRPHVLYAGVISCPRAASCLGHSNFTNATGLCAPGYEGKLCQSCEEHAGRCGWDECCTCPSASGLRIAVCLMGFGTLAVLTLLIFSFQGWQRLGVLLRILLNYLHCTMLMADFSFSWPNELRAFFKFHQYVSDLAEQFPVDCFYAEAFFSQLVVVAVWPCLLAAIFLAWWVLMQLMCKACGKSVSVFSNVVAGFLTGFTYWYPWLVRVALSAFACVEVGAGEYWLRTESEVQCWTARHFIHALGVSLPAILLWVLGVPMLALLLLKRYRNRLNEGFAKTALGFLHIGYQPRFYYWGIIVMIRTIVMGLLFELLSRSSPIQSLLLLLLLGSLTVLHYHYSPYNTSSLNKLEGVSQLVVVSTAYASVYFSSGRLSSGARTVLLCLVLTLHVCFLAYWLATCFSFKLRVILSAFTRN